MISAFSAEQDGYNVLLDIFDCQGGRQQISGQSGEEIGDKPALI
jgi:hypothetical protein